ncbi:MAG TPA: hypothetical protein VM260_21745, partial [Pirellula sp.]|nr:hypothetical protein [Pirellula sp.]
AAILSGSTPRTPFRINTKNPAGLNSMRMESRWTVRGTWVNKSGGQLVFKMQMFFDNKANYLPTAFLQTVHDGKLSGDDLLKDKVRLASNTRTTWKKFDNMLLPSHVESTICRNLDPDEYQT